MNNSFKILIVGVIAVFAAASYSVFGPSETPENTNSGQNPTINSYLKGEMALLEVLEVPQSAPAHALLMEDGTQTSVAAMKGKVVLVNLWASWCAPCRVEMKELANLQNELGDDDFEVVAINVDRGGILAAKDALTEWNVPFGENGLALYADPSMKTAFDIAEGKLPTSLIVNKDGNVIAKYVGPRVWDAPEAISLFEAMKSGEI